MKIGSIFITVAALVIAGFYLKCNSERVWMLNQTSGIIKKHLVTIFILAFLLRYCVWGMREIPIGNDAPTYLYIALKGSEMNIECFISAILCFNNLDCPNKFAMIWLGLIGSAFKTLGIDYFYISKVVMTAISSLVPVSLYYLVSLYDRKVAWMSGIVLSFLPSELLFAQLYKEILGELLILISFIFCLKYLNLKKKHHLFILLSLIFVLFKVSLTAFTWFVIFVIPLLFYFFDSKKTIFLMSITLLSLLILAILNTHLLEFLIYRKIEGAFKLNPYSYLAVPNVLMTNQTAFLISLPLFVQILFCGVKGRLSHLKALSMSVVIPVFLLSFVASTIFSYHLFPTSLFYYSLRLSLYLSIPLSILVGIILYNQQKLTFVLVFLLLILDFVAAALPLTTIHNPMLSSAIDDETYNFLNSIEYNNTIVVGNFSTNRYGLNGEMLGLKNWIKYIVYKKTGEDPIFVEPSQFRSQFKKEIKNTTILLCTKEKIIVYSKGNEIEFNWKRGEYSKNRLKFKN